MRRVMLLALALALPTAALASGFDFPSGTFSSGTISGTFATGGHLNVSLVGSLNTIGIMTGTLTELPASFCPGATACFTFTGGTVTVPTQSGFTNPLESGFVTRTGGEVGIHAVLAPGPGVAEGSASFDFHFSGTTITRGEAGVQGQSTVPEPDTLGMLVLGLLGNGVIGLARLTRRKLNLGT